MLQYKVVVLLLQNRSRCAQGWPQAGFERRVRLHGGVNRRPEVIHALQVPLVAAVEVVHHGVRRGESLGDLDHVRVQRGVHHLVCIMKAEEGGGGHGGEMTEGRT